MKSSSAAYGLVLFSILLRLTGCVPPSDEGPPPRDRTPTPSPTALPTVAPTPSPTSVRSTDPRWRLTEINTWRRFARHVTDADVRQMVAEWQAAGLAFSAVTIDDGWFEGDALGRFRPDPQAFPNLPALVDWLHSQGVLARVWVAPVNVSPAAADDFPESWFFRQSDGQRYVFPGLNVFALDARVPEVQQYLRALVRRLIVEYRFDGLKCDFGIAEPLPGEVPLGVDWVEINDAWLSIVYDELKQLRPDASLQYYVFYPGTSVDEYLGTDFAIRPRTLADQLAVGLQVRSRSLARGLFGRSDMLWGLGDGYDTDPTTWAAGYAAWLAQEVNLGNKIEASWPHWQYPNAAALNQIINLYSSSDRQAPNGQLRVFYAGQTRFTPDELRGLGVPCDSSHTYLVAAYPAAEVRFPLQQLQATTAQVRDMLTGMPVPTTIANGELVLTAPAGTLFAIVFN